MNPGISSLGRFGRVGSANFRGEAFRPKSIETKKV